MQSCWRCCQWEFTETANRENLITLQIEREKAVEDIDDLLSVPGVGGAISDWVRLTATNPARLFGLYPRKGTLVPGSDADVVIFDPEKHKALDAESLHMRTDISPYSGWKIQGWPRHVLQRGRFAVKDGAFVGQPGDGEFIPRQCFTLP